jgi:hypothetical protein
VLPILMKTTEATCNNSRIWSTPYPHTMESTACSVSGIRSAPHRSRDNKYMQGMWDRERSHPNQNCTNCMQNVHDRDRILSTKKENDSKQQKAGWRVLLITCRTTQSPCLTSGIGSAPHPHNNSTTPTKACRMGSAPHPRARITRTAAKK